MSVRGALTLAPARRPPLEAPRPQAVLRAPRSAGVAAAALAAICGICGADGGADSGACTARFTPPAAAPLHATDLNGVALPDVCFNGTRHHVFVIGDWGGIASGNSTVPVPADHRSPKFPNHARPFVAGVDDRAQLRVAEQMQRRAPRSRPDYIINVGDNFYWCGIKAKCGSPAFHHVETGQWGPIFERIYHGPGLDGIQWLGVLGNHDYGGYMFTMAWDQAIGYTWRRGPPSSGRWVTPAQYWSTKVHYPGFSVDYYFVDSNVFDAFDPHSSMGHNICGLAHNPDLASCGAEGPQSVDECPKWFAKLWVSQVLWLQEHLEASTAEWQIVVTHFPPEWGKEDWRYLSKYGIDLIITGHRHVQQVQPADGSGNFLHGTPWIVSGGGGGITSEGNPQLSGEDDQYGFFDLTLSKKEITIRAISHGGQLRSTSTVRPRRSGLRPFQRRHRSRRGRHHGHRKEDVEELVDRAASDLKYV